jgi:mono/diheme cytochrome c family protein
VNRRFLLPAGLVALVGGTGCRTHDVFRELDWSWNRMQTQPRYDIYAASPFFDDGKAMRAPPDGTVPFGPNPEAAPGLDGTLNGAYVTTFPLPITRQLLEVGRSRFQITCSACHGMAGDGKTVVATYMGRPPPSLHELRIRLLPHGRIYEVIRDGYGLMPSYATHLSVDERWAVVAYVRALERSQNAVVARLPPAVAADLEREAH